MVRILDEREQLIPPIPPRPWWFFLWGKQSPSPQRYLTNLAGRRPRRVETLDGLLCSGLAPPSVHPSGARYWCVVSPDEAELAMYGSNSRRFRKWLRW